MKVWITHSIFAAIIIATSFAQAIPTKVGPVEIKTERVGGMTHFEFSGQKDWQYDLKKDKGQILITLPKVSESSTEELEKFTSLLVEKVEIDNSTQNKTKITLNLSDARVESFDYLTQEPSNLVIDFYVGDDSILQSIKKAKVAKAKAKAEKAKKLAKNKVIKRGPAFAEFFDLKGAQKPMVQKPVDNSPLSLKPIGPIDELFDFGSILTGDADDSLEAKVVEAEGNIYLRYPLLKLKNKHLQDLQSFRPEYEIRKSFSDENKQARALLALFNQRSFAAFIKAKKIYKKNFPESTYDEILSYIEADTWVELWKMNKRPEYLSKAMNIYKMLIERYPNSKINERTLIHAGLLSHEAGEYFLATKLLRRYLKNYPDSPFNNHIKIYLGDALAHLKNYDGARNALDQVIKSDEAISSVEARYRLGDIYFLKQSYRRAERAYTDAINHSPKDLKYYPNALFNMAEAQFNLAEYPTSLKTFTRFFETYPNHEFSGYALTRVGELIDILYKDKRRAQGFYNESFYRFRKTTGGTIARMRSLSQRFKDMKDKELRASIAEIKKRERFIDLHQVDEFAAFMISDGYYERGNYLKAANALINYFQVNPKPINMKKFEKRISRAIAGEIRKRLSEGDIVAALDIIESHQKSWLSKSQRVDVQYFRAQAYERMGLVDEALNSFKRIEKRMKSLAGTKEETERKVFEYYPTFDQVYLRQAVTQYNRKNTGEAVQLLKKVKNIKGLDEQSKVDYYYTLSRLSFDGKNYADALKTALQVKSDTIEDLEKKEKFNVYLSEVYEKNKKFDKALSILEKFYEKFKGEQDQVYVLSRLFKLYRNKGMGEKAMKTGNQLLADYSKKYNLDKERYYLGELYFNSKNRKQAQKVWKDLTKKSMWSELARNKAVTGDWKKKTEDSINRIPAMAK